MAGNKRPRLSKLSDQDEAALGKLSRKERSKAVIGKPDNTDRDNLVRLFETYDAYTDNRLRKFLETVRVERVANGRNEKEKSVDTAENLAFAMPKDLQEEVEKYWPTIWTNKEHLRWFLKTFPMFRR